jgi:hypothetical protein
MHAHPRRYRRRGARLVRTAQLLASLWLVGFAGPTTRWADAAPPTPREQQLITELVQRNFDACNREDIDALMQTCTSQMPDREKFRRESLACFAAKDIHYSLVECEVLDVQWPWAMVRIVQDTHVLDRSTDGGDQAAYWNGTALLPQAGRVEYFTTCRREDGKWRLHLIVSKMRRVGR